MSVEPTIDRAEREVMEAVARGASGTELAALITLNRGLSEKEKIALGKKTMDWLAEADGYA